MVVSLLKRIRPPSRLAGFVAVPNLLFALGFGTFMTGSAVFYTLVVGLSASQVGLGLTVAGVVGLATTWPLSKLIDRLGSRSMMALSLFISSGIFLTWPFITTFTQYLAMEIAFAISGALGAPALNTYTIAVLPPEERVSSRAYIYAGLNLGFTLGALGAGIALAFNSLPIVRAIPWFTALVFLVAAVVCLRLPDPPDEARKPGERRAKIPGIGALRNPGWLATNFFSGVLMTNNVLLNVVIPLWLVQRTDAPHVVLAFLFGTNTVMCIFLPMAAARTVTNMSTALRAVRIATGFFVLSCVITLFTHHTVGLVTILLIWLGHVAVTGAELFGQAGNWSFDADLMDPRRRGEYQGAGHLAHQLGVVWAPALFTYLAMSWGTAGWMVIAGIAAVAGAAIHPSVRLAERFLVRHVPDEAAPSEHESPSSRLDWLGDGLAPEPEG